VTALKPEGCVGADCALPGRSMRSGGGALEALLFVGAVALIGTGVAALVIEARRADRFGKLGRIGLLCAVLGLGVLVSGFLIQALFFAGDFPYMPLVVLPGGLAMLVGLLILGVVILRADILPRWSAVLLVLGTLAMLGFNDQDSRVLLAIPFGVAWMGVGYALLVQSRA
jgi:hypothetical protein